LVISKRLLTLILVSLVLAVSGCSAVDRLTGAKPVCNGDFSGLMPQGWAFISQTPLDTDGVAPIECVVLYKFDTQTQEGQKITPVGGVVYRQDHGKPRWIYPHPLTPPGNFYLGERQVSARADNVLTGSPEPELIIEDRDANGTIVQISLFGWRDNKKDQLDADPSFNPDIMSYKPLGLFQGDGGVTVEKDQVTILVRRKDTRSQLADRKVYLPRADKKNYYGQNVTDTLTVAETDITSLAMGDDPTASPYPEKTVLAFYQNVKDDAKLEGLMTPDALGLLKANKLAYGCVSDRAQLDRVLVQAINWDAGTEAAPQVMVGGKCKLKDGSVKDLPVTTWLLEKNSEGKWRLKGVAQ
jgi:hypothetical protein